MAKRLLYLEDLYSFYLEQGKSYNFDAKESGYQLSVQIPASFEVKDEVKDDSLLFCKVKLMHSGENRNHSNVTDEALLKAGKTLAYKPILANFMEYVDEETGETLKDFTSHDLIDNEDGTTTYFEKQIGCFTADEPFYEVEDKTGHNFLYGYCAIPKEYTDACSIIKRKGGTKISVELAVNTMVWNNDTKVLDLTDVIIMGATCLGKNPQTLKDVSEGMENARLDIADFSAENNSVKFDKDEKMIELLGTLNERLSDFNKYYSQKGGKTKMFEELLTKYNKTVDDITFDYEGLSDDELEAKFKEAFEDVGTVDPVSTDEDAKETDKDTKEQFKAVIRTYELCHDDIRTGLYQLLAPYEESSNTCYWISKVYDSYFVYEDYATQKVYGQAYSKTDETVAFEGERYELFPEFLTLSEKTELEAMRSKYAEVVDKLEKYEAAENEAKKTALLDSEEYASVKDTEEFAALIEKHDNITFEELQSKCDNILLNAVKTGSFKFAEGVTGKVSKKNISNPSARATKPSRYGKLFKEKN